MDSTHEIPGSRASPFLSLPYELRDKIYHMSLDWPDLPLIFARLSRECKTTGDEINASRDPTCAFPRLRFGTLTAPTVLLLNKQIRSEALPILLAKTLIIPGSPPSNPTTGQPIDITEIISEETLQSVRRVVLRMNLEMGAIRRTVDTLLDVWSVKNSLEELVVDITAAYTDERWIIGEESARQEAAHVISKVSTI